MMLVFPCEGFVAQQKRNAAETNECFTAMNTADEDGDKPRILSSQPPSFCAGTPILEISTAHAFVDFSREARHHQLVAFLWCFDILHIEKTLHVMTAHPFLRVRGPMSGAFALEDRGSSHILLRPAALCLLTPIHNWLSYMVSRKAMQDYLEY